MDADVKAAKAPGKRTRNAADTREKILKAARSEFAQHGFAGGRTERILAAAGANPRMLYHYFGGKSGLYVAVLEEALGSLREQELKIDVEHLSPFDGLIQLFEHMNRHFESDLRLVQLLRNENLERARHMKISKRIRDMSSPVLTMIADLLRRGAEDGTVRSGIDELQFYIIIVALNQFHLSNVHTLSVIFDQDLSRQSWRAARHETAVAMIRAFLTPTPIS